jgi:hypothetical protein
MSLPPAFRQFSAMRLALELPRAGLDAVGLASVWPLLLRAPGGDGHPVLVLPGFGATDVSTRVLRGFLRDRGYHVHAWRLGRNLGPRAATVDGLRSRVTQLARRHQRKMSLVGWSLGGVYARELAKSCPECVRQVITLATPFQALGHGNHAGALFRLLHPEAPHVDPELQERVSRTPPVPTTSIYSKTDGIVSWRGCLERKTRRSESIEVATSHLGMVSHAQVLRIVAQRLAQPEGQWRPFKRAEHRRSTRAGALRG